MAILRSTVCLMKKSGIEVDCAKNVWHFETAGAITPANMDTAAVGLRTFYTDLAAWFGPSVSRAVNAHHIEHAQVTQGGAGAADDIVSKILRKDLFDTPALPNSAGLPSEVAVALSFRGETAGVQEENAALNTRPASQRRGRIYVGPLTGNTSIDEAVTGRIQVTDAFKALLLDKYELALAGWVGAAGGAVRHIVYSRVAGATHPVVSVHVDDAFDTVRRRGEAAEDRTTRAVVQAAI